MDPRAAQIAMEQMVRLGLGPFTLANSSATVSIARHPCEGVEERRSCMSCKGHEGYM